VVRALVSLMRDCRCALLSVVIIHNKAGVNDSRNPPEQRQNEAQEKTRDATGHEHGQRWKNYAEKISQCFHVFFLPEDFFIPLPDRSFSNS